MTLKERDDNFCFIVVSVYECVSSLFYFPGLLKWIPSPEGEGIRWQTTVSENNGECPRAQQLKATEILRQYELHQVAAMGFGKVFPGE